MNWYIIGIIIYLLLLIVIIIRILFETQSASKSLAYVMFVLFVPVAGMLFYLVFGINYWVKKKYAKKMAENAAFMNQIRQSVGVYDRVVLNAKDSAIAQNAELSYMLLKDLGSPLTRANDVTILANGENKFPELLKDIQHARHHIHVEYYIYECDETGMTLIEALIEKARQGVIVRFIYDDFGSPGINSKLEKRMKAAGIHVFAFHKIKFYLLANRFNYRNHRKILIVDGQVAFVGGINVSDKYVNTNDGKKKLYWRDTHVRIEGPAVYYLQFLFMSDWKFCCNDESFETDSSYFGDTFNPKQNCYVQVAAGGPDSVMPTILYSMLQAINLSKEEILITTPYFIPGDSMMDAICVAAMSGIKVKLLVPGISDSKIVNAASKSYYKKLLEAGVDIYLYQKGFVHAKTMVCDGKLSIVGTANMDYRSFELNFEVNALVYDGNIGKQMRELFMEDIQHAEKIDKEQWYSRAWYVQLPEKLARLFSPVL